MTAAKRGAGRPAYEPSDRDRKQVKMLAALGVPDYHIEKLMGVSGPTLRKYFWQELEMGHIEANVKVAQSLFQMATNAEKPNVAAAIFWLKVRAGWRDVNPEGKKAEVEATARTAHEGTSWDGLLQ